MIRELRVALTVQDFDAALHVFRDLLGLETLQEWRNPDGRGAILAVGRATLELFDAAQAASVDHIEAGARLSGVVRLALEVEDLEYAARSFARAGTKAVAQPRLTPWGDRNQRLQTPEGLQITLFVPSEGRGA
ncbi:VOC family protein [Calidithermus roseus]|uniref:Methylmalonyl-CoA epimerase n=1 Tax=Calidithermus roseus TaxID=1644118 RepID=A0A399ESE5_9DEIN|nr:VOC family protein [Calidithermus roseus]RIH85502.1 methylmalonyl-CoA epimerase [Calidithermus roseus]